MRTLLSLCLLGILLQSCNSGKASRKVAKTFKEIMFDYQDPWKYEGNYWLEHSYCFSSASNTYRNSYIFNGNVLRLDSSMLDKQSMLLLNGIETPHWGNEWGSLRKFYASSPSHALKDVFAKGIKITLFDIDNTTIYLEDSLPAVDIITMKNNPKSAVPEQQFPLTAKRDIALYWEPSSKPTPFSVRIDQVIEITAEGQTTNHVRHIIIKDDGYENFARFIRKDCKMVTLTLCRGYTKLITTTDQKKHMLRMYSTAFQGFTLQR